MSTAPSCVSKYLPSEVLLDAARTAVLQNPANRPLVEPSGGTGIILPPEHLAVLTSKYWGNKGVSLTVAFTESINNDLATRIIAHMNAWSKYANVKFERTTTDPQVRITRAQSGYWSYLGTDVLHIPKGDPTMCLEGFTMQTAESEFRRVVRHETGHTLGFPHEHMRRAIIDRLDARKTIQYFKDTQGWSAAMVQSQVLTPLSEASIMSTPDADETSIMTYNLPGIITKDGRPIIGGTDIAPQDIEFVAKIYPKATVEPPPPEPPVGKGLEIRCDDEAKVVHIWLKPGWKVVPKSKVGGIVMDTTVCNALADELEALVPQADTGNPAGAALGGVISAVLELIAALRSGEVNRIIKALRDLLNVMLGDDDTQVIGFQKAAGLRNINWKRLIEIVTKLMPLILAGA